MKEEHSSQFDTTAICRCVGVFTFLFAFALFAGVPLFAKKGGNGGGGGGNGGGGNNPPAAPVPEGVIYFTYQRDVLAMNPDGTGQTVVLPASTWPSGWKVGDPSSLVYGTDPVADRWFLVSRELDVPQVIDVIVDETGAVIGSDVPMPELFAVKPDASVPGGLLWVQLTSSFGDIYAASFGGRHWSNDAQDAFISFEGKDLGSSFSYADIDGDGDDESILDYAAFQAATSVIYRIPVTGLEIEVMGTGLVPFAASELDALDVGAVVESHDWLTDGSKVVVQSTPVAQLTRAVEVIDFATGVIQWTLADGSSPRWSTDGHSIAVRLGSILYGGLYDVDAVDPNIQSPIREDKRRDYYTNPVWGPPNAAAEGASTHLVYVERTNRLYTYPEDIVLSAVDGSGSVSLAGNLNLSTYDSPGRPLRWVGNGAAW